MPELALLPRHCINPPAVNSRCASEESPSTISIVCRRIYAPNSDTQLDALALFYFLLYPSVFLNGSNKTSGFISFATYKIKAMLIHLYKVL